MKKREIRGFAVKSPSWMRSSRAGLITLHTDSEGASGFIFVFANRECRTGGSLESEEDTSVHCGHSMNQRGVATGAGERTRADEIHFIITRPDQHQNGGAGEMALG